MVMIKLPLVSSGPGAPLIFVLIHNIDPLLSSRIIRWASLALAFKRDPEQPLKGDRDLPLLTHGTLWDQAGEAGWQGHLLFRLAFLPVAPITHSPFYVNGLVGGRQ